MGDPSAQRPPRRRPGRPTRTSLTALIDAAVELGLDRFSVPAVAAHVGVAESTVYGYVPSREALYAAAASSVFERLDTTTDATGWPAFVDTISQRTFDLAAAHPGLRDYVLWGPYTATTATLFESLVERVQHWLPDAPDHVAWVVASRPLVLSLGYLGDPVLQPMAPWLRRALIAGLEQQLAAGTLPDTPTASWRHKIRPDP